MSGEIKVLVTSDLHLGLAESPVSMEIRLRTFQKIISLAMENDILMISGDLFDAAGVDDLVMKTVNNEFKKLREKGTEILYCPGMAEIRDGAYTPSINNIDATRVFTQQEAISPYYYEKDGQMLVIYGAPALYPFSPDQRLRSDDDGFHLGLFHVNFNPESSQQNNSDLDAYRMNRNDIKTMGLDFYIFGYNHTFKMFKIQDKIIAAYPGSPEAAAMEETGDRYVLSFSIIDNAIQNIRRLAVNTITMDSLVLDCASYSSFYSITAQIEARKSKKVFLTATLIGNRNYPIDPDTLKKFHGEFYALRLIDVSTPTMEMFFTVYGHEESVRGEMLRIIKEMIQNGDIPSGVSDDNITQIIKHLVAGDSDALEEWLCAT